jgi:SEC-C motif-containing protein
MKCPCGNERDFSSCCEIIHQDLAKAETAEKLMRARYTAFVVGNIDFLYHTFHPTTRRFQTKKEIESWAKQNKWMQLEILNSTYSTVEFKAHYLDQHFDVQVHHEKSKFMQVQHMWYYVEGMLTD